MNLAITGAELKLPNVPQSPNAGPTLLRAEMQAATVLRTDDSDSLSDDGYIIENEGS